MDKYLTQMANDIARFDQSFPEDEAMQNRIPDDVRDKVVKLALDEPDLSPRELAVRFTDTEKTSCQRPQPTGSSSLTTSSPVRHSSS